jgi:hypothetical protein
MGLLAELPLTRIIFFNLGEVHVYSPGWIGLNKAVKTLNVEMTPLLRFEGKLPMPKK